MAPHSEVYCSEGAPTIVATHAEQERFIVANEGDEKAANNAINKYLQYRRERLNTTEKGAMIGKQLPPLISLLRDTYSLDGSFLKIARTEGKSSSTGRNINPNGNWTKRIDDIDRSETSKENLSVTGNVIRDNDNRRCILYMAAMYNPKLGTAKEYTNAVSIVLDEIMPREEHEKFTILVDTRAGKGWKNPYVWSILDFVKNIISVLSAYFPERVAKVVVYPVPRLCNAFYNAIRSYLPENTRSKVVLVAGEDSSETAPVPDKLLPLVGKQVIDAIENFKVAHENFENEKDLPVASYGNEP
mmetsp:Transcript_4509/g.8782  ORF Transcript_4509/g.8782 Transcript_4509/m.8782 type:complete len:301 (-) Transcript_4509:392-1294(-)|eukprot:CAMPEP_0113311094 /NCGR_PEP_ID=MMETSP0010_2-20120614/8472_1 /TAXON_ID=216773 ORGANISM="Corethron hystrix, Strain 308" /NCGR_SAMPLE_ID=MMETSP0010_2 /ASSEMBLY_ACC=CAM_ASM_000155 /LENGTH=300 /DNA_ID=CAMNT_0000166671 /DNA_START=117 /DNA_END=1019 /DNA_ORIENTATION=+ /assembly_acc=CAM_ASM_000155